MSYFNFSVKYIVFQTIFGLIPISYATGQSFHVSGSTYNDSNSSIPHISGQAYLGVNNPNINSHVSGSTNILTIKKDQPNPSNLIRRAREIGITIGIPEESILTESEVTVDKTKRVASSVKTVEYLSRRNRIEKRKACWKKCENMWKVNVEKRCSSLSALLQEVCEKDLFKEHLFCVTTNCKKLNP